MTWSSFGQAPFSSFCDCFKTVEFYIGIAFVVLLLIILGIIHMICHFTKRKKYVSVPATELINEDDGDFRISCKAIDAFLRVLIRDNYPDVELNKLCITGNKKTNRICMRISVKQSTDITELRNAMQRFIRESLGQYLGLADVFSTINVMIDTIKTDSTPLPPLQHQSDSEPAPAIRPIDLEQSQGWKPEVQSEAQAGEDAVTPLVEEENEILEK